VFFFSGIYWIDPNQGSVEDAFTVFCGFDNDGETCVYSVNKTVSEVLALATFQIDLDLVFFRPRVQFNRVEAILVPMQASMNKTIQNLR
jgi:hypothetical protein